MSNLPTKLGAEVYLKNSSIKEHFQFSTYGIVEIRSQRCKHCNVFGTVSQGTDKIICLFGEIASLKV